VSRGHAADDLDELPTDRHRFVLDISDGKRSAGQVRLRSAHRIRLAHVATAQREVRALITKGRV
jgi:hypothetical protein